MMVIHAVPNEIRSPVAMVGSAAGMQTRVVSWIGVQPNVLAAVMKIGGTPLTPAIVFSSTGKKLPMTMMNTLPESPMPNQRMASGIQASGEMGRNNSTKGRTYRSSRSLRPMAIPSGMATATARVQARKIRPRLAPVCWKSTPEASRRHRVSTTARGPGRSVVFRITWDRNAQTAMMMSPAVTAGSALRRAHPEPRGGMRLGGSAPLTEEAPQHFARAAHGQLIAEVDGAGSLVRREPGAVELDHLGRRDVAAVAVLEDHVRLDRFPPRVVGNTHDGRQLDGGMGVQRLLHFARPYLEAGRVDHVLLAVDDAEVAFGIHDRNVARAQPAVADRIRRRLRTLPVAAHHLRPPDQE